MRPEHDERRPGQKAAFSVNSDSSHTLHRSTDAIAHMQRRVILDALLEAWPAYWERRARSFEAARPNPDRDFVGQSTQADLRDQWRRLTEAAAACRARGQVSPLEVIVPEVDAVFGEVS